MSMTVEQKKHLLAIETHKQNRDVEKLAGIARLYLMALAQASNYSEGPNNYDVVAGPTVWGEYTTLASGTKDYCIGFAENNTDWDNCCVVCGKMVVWPEDKWGETLEEINKDEDQ